MGWRRQPWRHEARCDVGRWLASQCLSRDNYRAGAAQIKEIAALAGRDPGQFCLSVRANLRLNPLTGGATMSGFDGSSQDVVNAIGDYARVGVEHVVLAPDSGNVALLLDKMRQIARDVIPNFREAGVADAESRKTALAPL